MKGSSFISKGLKTAIGIGFGSGGFEEDNSQTFDKLQHKINVAWRQQPSGACWTVSDPSLGSYEHNERVQLHLSNGVKTAIGIGFGSGFEEDHSQTFGQLQHKINVAWRLTAIRSLLDCVSDPSLGSYEHNETVQLHLKWSQEGHRHCFWLRRF
jgi:hypothetical protein